MTDVRLVETADADALFALRRENRDFLAPWEPAPPPGGESLAGTRNGVAHLREAHANGTCVPLVILDGERIVGRVTLSNIVRSALQSAIVGYWVAEPDNGRGHASAAVAAVLELAFGELGLHRVEAGTLVHNTASQRVLARNGFERYGLAPEYLRIGGRWQDHVLFQRLAPSA